MPSQLKSFIKVGMRNPYSVDVKMDVKGDSDLLFATGSSKNAVIVSLDEKSVQNREQSLNQISELPRGLTNYYVCV